MTQMLESYRPLATASAAPSAPDPLLLELRLVEAQQDNARLRRIVAELLVKNQILRWSLLDEETTR